MSSLRFYPGEPSRAGLGPARGRAVDGLVEKGEREIGTGQDQVRKNICFTSPPFSFDCEDCGRKRCIWVSY